MRNFSLYINGSELKLNGETGVWFTEPEGLGVTINPSMVNLRNGFFKAAAKDLIPQVPIVGTLTFEPSMLGVLPLSAYENYHLFQSSVVRANTLELGYTPFDNTEYRIQVELNYLTKSELTGNWLKVPVSFAPLSPWFIAENITVPISASQDDVDTYVAEYTPKGDIPAAFEIVGDGGTPLLIGAEDYATGDVYGIFSIPASELINPSGSFEFSTKYNNSYARFTGSGETTDLVKVVQIPNTGVPLFPRLPPYTKSRILLLYAAGTSKPTSINMKVFNYFRSA